MELGRAQEELRTHAFAVCKQGRAAWPLKSKAAVLLSAVIRQRGTQAYSEIVPQLIMQASEGPPQVRSAQGSFHMPFHTSIFTRLFSRMQLLDLTSNTKRRAECACPLLLAMACDNNLQAKSLYNSGYNPGPLQASATPLKRANN